MPRSLFPVLIVSFWLFCHCLGSNSGVKAPSSAVDSLEERIELVLEKEIIEVWYPRCIDSTYGGFLSDFDVAWNPDGTQDKMIVTQARHVWSASKAFERFPDRDIYLEIAKHGVNFLQESMWDSIYGGFYNLVSRQGNPIPNQTTQDLQKQAYGNAFAIYGLAAYFKVSRDTSALELAQKAFRWLEIHSHDPVHGGYFQFLHRDGTPWVDGFAGTPAKDQNSSIHLLEAFTELYQVWPDALVGERLREMLTIIRDTLTGDKGYLTLFCARDWTPLSYRDSAQSVREAHYHLDEVSFGHDIETAYLLREAEEVLDHPITSKTELITKKMADHALDHGFDTLVGGLYDAGYYQQSEGPISLIRTTKNWWAQAETLNTLLILAQAYPEDPRAYLDLFKKQWHYIDNYLVDHEYGGWYNYGLDQSPESKSQHKAHIWKSPYHTERALLNVTARLKKMD